MSIASVAGAASLGDARYLASGLEGPTTLTFSSASPSPSASAFRVTITPTGPGSFDLTWKNAEGVNFKVEASDTLGSGWETEAIIRESSSPASLTHPVSKTN